MRTKGQVVSFYMVCAIGIMFYESFTALFTQILLLFVFGCTVFNGIGTFAKAAQHLVTNFVTQGLVCVHFLGLVL
uniref:hypothetical protein n=1 Tax=Paenimyroides marinum TaxID=1159016 RepID=UPI001FE055B2|nr:hypothetical protein [Paenimyroides aquimaris]